MEAIAVRYNDNVIFEERCALPNVVTRTPDNSIKSTQLCRCPHSASQSFHTTRRGRGGEEGRRKQRRRRRKIVSCRAAATRRSFCRLRSPASTIVLRQHDAIINSIISDSMPVKSAVIRRRLRRVCNAMDCGNTL